MTGVWIAVAAVAAALLFGAYRAATDGRFRGTHKVAGADTAAHDSRLDVWAALGDVAVGTPGEFGTLLQFSSAFCAPCRVTRRILEDVAKGHDGVRHLEVDAEHHLDLVRTLGVMRTPTTIILDRTGREVGRAVGAPTKDQVSAALKAL
jgi:thiol-disulfide isomerase/thioredoxin